MCALMRLIDIDSHIPQTLSDEVSMVFPESYGDPCAFAIYLFKDGKHHDIFDECVRW